MADVNIDSVTEKNPQLRDTRRKERGAGNYGVISLRDYFVWDGDPSLQAMEEETEERTLARYTHNRKKVFTWTAIAGLFAGLATTLAAVTLTAQFDSVFLQSIAEWWNGKSVLAAPELIKATTSKLVAWAAGLAVGSTAIAAYGSFVAFKTDIKNDLDTEEWAAKRIGKYMAIGLRKLANEQSTDLVTSPTEQIIAASLSPNDDKVLAATAPAPPPVHKDKPGVIITEAEVARMLNGQLNGRVH